MEGHALHWFSLLWEGEPELSWEMFKEALLERFGGLSSRNPYEQLSEVVQNGSVAEYIESFEVLAFHVTWLLERQALGYFMDGLKPEIRRWVRIHQPETVSKAFLLARDIEQALIGDAEGRAREIGSKGFIGSKTSFNRVSGSNTYFTPQNSRLKDGEANWNMKPEQGAGTGTDPKKFMGPKNRGTRHLSAQEVFDRKKKRVVLSLWATISPPTSMP